VNGRRVVVGWFGLVVLYTALTQSEKIAGLLGTTTAATRRLSDPKVALIKNRAGGTSTASPPAKDNSTAAVYGAGGSYVGSTFVPSQNNSQAGVYGVGGGRYVGSTFVPAK